MSNGDKKDYVSLTQQVLSGQKNPVYEHRSSTKKNPETIKVEEKTWLDHRLSTEGGKMDLLILDAKYTADDIAEILFKEQSKAKKRTVLKCKARLKDHINHLEHKWNMKIAPHKLEIQGKEGGILSFGSAS